ncbi:hypothetical protein C453_12806 [Haloferax elongans ATCC BAA-1513]|uniref:Uncharacterized protein n=2 Tax=Haloferax elongans TaxID=403191 RepID=M0HIV5_HALEO|nr:hypothetical protein C453_12806 [Haloferax elongans ATCC BAA-1513]
MQNSFAHDLGNDIEAEVLHNLVHDDLNQDDQLTHYCDAAAEADAAADIRESYESRDAEFVDELEHAWDSIATVAHQRAFEVVAESCVTVISDGDEWADEGHYDVDAVDNAKHEAREWLQTHTDIAERVGALEVLA